VSIDPAPLSEKVEKCPDARGKRAALADMNRMKGFPIAGIQVFKHGHETAGGNVVANGEGRKARKPAAAEREPA
jgi:hypothetical protein